MSETEFVAEMRRRWRTQRACQTCGVYLRSHVERSSQATVSGKPAGLIVWAETNNLVHCLCERRRKNCLGLKGRDLL